MKRILRVLFWSVLIGIPAIFVPAFVVLVYPDPEDRILPGMTLGQVEAILGAPSDRSGQSETSKYRYWTLPDRTVKVSFEAWKENPTTLGEVRVEGSTQRARIAEWIKLIASGYVDLPPSRPRHASIHWAGDPE